MKGQVLAISGDSQETMKEFKESLKAEYPFIADPEARLMKLYDVKYPLFTVAARWSFVVGDNRKVIKVFSGSDAIKAEDTIAACGRPKKSEAIEAAGEYQESSSEASP